MYWGQVISPSMGDKISVTVIATGFDNEQKSQPIVEEKINEPVPEPEPVIKDPNVVGASELNSILNGSKPEETTPFFFESNPDTTSPVEAAETTTEKEKNSPWGAELLKDEVVPQRRPFNRPDGFIDPNDLSQPAIWIEKYGRGIKLSD